MTRWLPAAQIVVSSRRFWLLTIWTFLTSAIRHSAALHCLQCSPVLNGVDLPDDKYQLRVTMALTEPKCDRHVEIYCEGGRNVCVNQAIEAEDSEEFWLVKGCDFAFRYDQLGCSTVPTSKSKTTVTRMVHQSHTDLQICVCNSNNCNLGTSLTSVRVSPLLLSVIVGFVHLVLVLMTR